MDNRKELYLYAFNQLAELVKCDELIDHHCRDIKECERTLDIIKRIVERMNAIVSYIE